MNKVINVSIRVNEIEGQDSAPVRIRLHHVNLENGDRHPSDIVFDVKPGEEHRVNITSPAAGFEVRPVVEGASYAGDDVVPDAFAVKDAYERLKNAVKAVKIIRGDATLSDAERDLKAAAAWADALRLASQ